MQAVVDRNLACVTTRLDARDIKTCIAKVAKQQTPSTTNLEDSSTRPQMSAEQVSLHIEGSTPEAREFCSCTIGENAMEIS
jgi:hypothetical protein